MKKVPRAGIIMDRNALILTRGTRVHDAAAALTARRQLDAPVVDEEGRLLGMFSQQGCIHALLAVVYEERPAGFVESYLEPPRATTTPKTSLLEMAQLFVSGQTRFPTLVVLDEGRIVGLVSRGNLIQSILDLIGPAPDLKAATLYISALREMDDAPSFERSAGQ